MSELKVNKVTPRSGTTVTLGDSGDSVAIPTGVGFNGFGYRNIVINGDMSIAQRFIRFEQYVEAQNLQYLKFGTAQCS
jgi:hypothetical protein